MPAGIMSSASINIIRSNPIISADLSGLSVIRSFIIRMNPVYDKTDGGLNGFHRSTSLLQSRKTIILHAESINHLFVIIAFGIGLVIKVFGRKIPWGPIPLCWNHLWQVSSVAVLNQNQFEKFSLNNGVIKVRRFIVQILISYIGLRIGIGNRPKAFLIALHLQFMTLLQGPEFLILMEVVVPVRQRVQSESLRT